MAKKKTTLGDKTTPKINPNINRDQALTTSNPTPVTAPEVNAAAAEPTVQPDPKTTTVSRIFEVRKAEARKNVVPINVEEEIRRRAYELYEQRGPGLGSQADDWLAAEREVMQRYHQQSA